MANTNLFKIFIEVANRGSITKAAEKLYISQPAITKSIKELESELGGKLFERKSRGVELTAEGRHIYDKVKPLLSELDSVKDYFSSVRKLKTGILRIGTSTSNITVLLSDALNRFINRHPNIEIKIVREKAQKLISQLRNNELDLAVLDKEQVKPDLVSVKDFAITYSVVGSKKYYLRAQRKPLTREAFAALPLALIDPAHTSRKNIDSYFQNFGLKLAAKYEMDNYRLIMDFIKKGVAIGIVNPAYFSSELQSQEIFTLDTDFAIDKRVISVVKFNHTNNNPARDVFVQDLLKAKEGL